MRSGKREDMEVGVCGKLTDLPCLGRGNESGGGGALWLHRFDSMARSLYSISPSPGPQDPSFSDDSSSLDGAPSAFTDFHHGPQPTSSRPGSPTPAGPPPGLDVVTCQWEDCGSAFDDLTTFIRHLHDGQFPFILSR